VGAGRVGQRGPETAKAEGCVTAQENVDRGPGGGPQLTRASEASGKENSAKSWPCRRPPSVTKNEARRGEATTSRKTLQPTSETKSRSNLDPNQNCSI
jgi:hypothetical protein